MQDIRFAIIGCGLMGREFASAAARWMHLVAPKARPRIVAVCDTNPDLMTCSRGNRSGSRVLPEHLGFDVPLANWFCGTHRIQQLLHLLSSFGLGLLTANMSRRTDDSRG